MGKGGSRMEYISTVEASKKWGVSLRQVQRLLAGNRIPCAKKYGRFWMIPGDAEKPVDPRREKKSLQQSLSADLSYVISATTIPAPRHNPDSILGTINEERLRLQYEGELAYLRGDFKQTLRCFLKTEGDDAARLRACPMVVAAAISMGDYRAYTEIEAFLKGMISTIKDSDISAFAELALATAAVSVIAPKMAPDWLKDGDFSAFAPQLKPYTLYLRAKYLHCVNQSAAALAVAQTALTLCASEQGITVPDIYLRLMCAVTCHSLGRVDDARRWVLEAMSAGLPYGFITPFAEVVTELGGLVELCLNQVFPDYYDAVIAQWKRTWKNWITFHNQFTEDNITLILSLREYHIALLVARRIPYATIAKQQCISVGRLKNIVMDIYSKLLISSRNDLAKYVLHK